MRAVHLRSDARGVAIGGLDWRSAPGKKAVAKALKGLDKREASHYVVAAGGEGHGAVGLYSALLEDNARMPKGAYSAAQAFAATVGHTHPSAALLLTHGRPEDDQVYVVVLEDGVPIHDLVTNSAQASKLIGVARHVFTDLAASMAGAEQASLALLEQAIPAARLRPMPVNVLGLVVITVLVLMAVTGYIGWKYKQRVEAERLAEEQARQQDPTPRYLAALAAQRNMAAPSRADLLKVAQQLFDQPTAAAGWSLEQIDCEVASGNCVSQWIRRGGTFADLKAAIRGSELLPPTGPVPDLERAVARFSISVKRGPLLAADSKQAYLKPPAIAVDLGGVLQVWKTAKLKVEQGPAVLWPAVPEVPAGFAHPEALTRAALAVGEVPGPFVGELIAASPWFVAWDAIGVSFTEAGEPANRVKFYLKGSVYAAQQ